MEKIRGKAAGHLQGSRRIMKKILVNGLLIDEKSAGIGHYGYALINALSKINKDYEISVMARQGIAFDGVRMIHKKYKGSLKRVAAEQLFLLKEYGEYDLVHFIDYSSPVIGTKKPFIVTIHDISFYKYPDTFSFVSRKIKQFITPFSIKRAAKIIADSESTKRDILSRFNIDESGVEVIYPGRPDYGRVEDKCKIEEAKRKYGVDGDYILYLGTLEPRKNIVRLIEAYESLVKEGIKEKLVIAGKKGWLYEEIFLKVQSAGLEKKVIFTGYVDEMDKPCLYSGARVFVYPSLYEGFGLPPLEAMTCGTPVVVSHTSSLPEVVGDAGIFVDPKNIDSISKGIYDIITNSSLRERISASGKARSKLFCWQKAAKKVLEIYDEVLEVKTWKP